MSAAPPVGFHEEEENSVGECEPRHNHPGHDTLINAIAALNARLAALEEQHRGQQRLRRPPTPQRGDAPADAECVGGQDVSDTSSTAVESSRSTSSASIFSRSSEDPMIGKLSRRDWRGGSGEEAALRHQLLSAVDHFRMAEGFRLLKQLGDAGGGSPSAAAALLGEEALERLRRIGSRYESFISSGFSVGQDWPVHGENKGMQMEWGFKLAHGKVRTMFVADFEQAASPTEAVLRAVAGFCEVDLMDRWNREVTRGEPLDGVAAPNDSLWRMEFVGRHTNAKFDGIWNYSAIDALDEDRCRAVLIDGYTADKRLRKLRGAALPPPPAGVWRGDSSRCLFRVTPTAKGCLMVGFFDLEVPEVMFRCLSMMPGFALRRYARVHMEDLVGRLNDFLATSPELQARLHGRGRRALFYHRLRSRLERCGAH